ncbi:disulfide isomerase DsbC N-terminal domain-containing protein [Trichlorobacter ammonificans]|uniref:Disulphide bond isomerase DsbC/G N-terminal domain-containing protein n=1 Tax=Trichlorobacter ammonificans TaxID=2916410 RepID=A0ABM9D6W0_9BACT|nr:disulfide isomerase DsbC N-terminal domain-containing protein [Trichlorobacter ammonificans]CAH2030124.1 exported protein of unknown function [Trichlorobacter ammonificans]
MPGSLPDRFRLFLPALLVVATAALASPPPAGAQRVPAGHDCTTCHTLSSQEAAALIKPLNLTVKTVRHSPVAGLFEVVAERDGREGIIYVDYAKKLLMQGVIVDAGQLRPTVPPETSTTP